MKNVLEYLENTAARIPDREAVTDPEGSLSWAELLEKARRIGSYLSTFLEPGQPAGLFMDKSCGALAAQLGIVYAGCFSVYLSADQGQLRVRRMMELSQIRVVLTDDPGRAAEFLSGQAALESQDIQPGKSGGETQDVHPGQAVRYLSLKQALASAADEGTLSGIRRQQKDTDPLYCNFTSGSTGMPKGVLVCHRSVIDFMNYFPGLFGITEQDVIGNQAPFDFDVSVKDIYSSLKTGARLALIPRRYFTVITSLLDYLDEQGVTTLIWAVSALCLLVQFRGFTYKVPGQIRRVLFSGEVMPQRFLKAWQDQYPDAEFVNLYGPSEITCNCTYFRIPRQEAEGGQTPGSDHRRRTGPDIGETDMDRRTGPDRADMGRQASVLPIGIPFPNESVFLLDEQDRLIRKPGIVGEICVAGTALALGYLNAPEATRKAFTQNPLNPHFPERIYRTGDLGKLGEDGNLYFCGRRDFQIKLFGHRIELEEVESALNGAAGVERACCLFNQEKNRLEGYYCGDVEPRQLKGRLEKLLPAYMVPSRLHRLEEMPVTPNGKIDRGRLRGMKSGGGER